MVVTLLGIVPETHAEYVVISLSLIYSATLSEIINEIFKAMNFVYINYGFKKYHTTGDSAGGYLAYMTALCARSRRAAQRRPLAASNGKINLLQRFWMI